MPEQHKSSPRERIAQRVADDSVLADFSAPFPDLLGGDAAELGGSFERMGKLLGRWKKAVRVQFTISEGGEERSWNLALTAQGTKAAEGRHRRPHVEVITDAETWRKIATGALAPLDAFVHGKIWVRGDITLARLIARRLADGDAAR